MLVYHCHRKQDKKDYSKGYIGATSDLDRRKVEHIKYASANNQHFQNALSKYSDIEWSVIFEGSEEDCLALEKRLRPEYNIGWNIAVGGGKPPIHHWTDRPNPMLGHNFSEDHRKKISDGNKGKIRTEKHKANYREAASKRGADHYDCHRGRKWSKEQYNIVRAANKAGVWVVNGNRYDFATDASKAEGIPKTTLMRKCKDKVKYPDFRFIPKEKQ